MSPLKGSSSRELSRQGKLVFIGDDDANAMVEFDVQVASGQIGERDFDVADIFDGPRFRALWLGHSGQNSMETPLELLPIHVRLRL